MEIEERDIYTFPEGLLGFAGFKRYIILPNPTGGPLEWLQSVDDEKLAFIICKPQLFKPDYRVPLRQEDLDVIELSGLEDGIVYTIMVVPGGKPREMTANLQGPLVFNAKKRLAKQYVLLNTDYVTKYRVFQD